MKTFHCGEIMDIQPTWDDLSDHALLVMAVDLGVESILLGVDARPKLLEQLRLKLEKRRSHSQPRLLPEVGLGPEILIHHGKYSDIYYLADTPERKDAAFRRLFKQFDECGCYCNCILSVLDSARAGDIRAIRELLDSRCKCEYEAWEARRALDPLKEKP